MEKQAMPSFEDLHNATIKAREEKKTSHLERINSGRADAIQYITNGCFEKMAESAKKGYDKTDIYSFKWTENPESSIDSNGNQIKFKGNVRLLDLMIKGKQEFIKELNEFFNKDGNAKYHCGYYRKKNDENDSESWNIFVSWASPEESFEKRSYNSSGRGGRGGGGRGRGEGRGEGGRGRRDERSSSGRGNRGFSPSYTGNRKEKL